MSSDPCPARSGWWDREPPVVLLVILLTLSPKETGLYNQDEDFELGSGDNKGGQAVQNYVEKWDVDDDLRELAGRLADVTGDDTYTRVLGDRDITSY